MMGLRFAWEEDARTFASMVRGVVFGQSCKVEDGPSTTNDSSKFNVNTIKRSE